MKRRYANLVILGSVFLLSSFGFVQPSSHVDSSKTNQEPCFCQRYRLAKIGTAIHPSFDMIPRVQNAQGIARRAQEILVQYTANKTANPGNPMLREKKMVGVVLKHMERIAYELIEIYSSGCPDDPEICHLEIGSKFEFEMLAGITGLAQKAAEDLHEYRKDIKLLALQVDLHQGPNGVVCDRNSSTYLLCLGHKYQRLIIINRYMLKRPDVATQWFEEAQTQLGSDNETVLWKWENQFHLPLQHRHELRSIPMWINEDRPKIADTLERHYQTIKKELALAGRKGLLDWTQDNYQLASKGHWSEVNLFQGNKWSSLCVDSFTRTCKVLSNQQEIVSETPPSLLELSGVMEIDAQSFFVNQVAFFRLRAGAKISPHAGPANYRIYCHLGISIPKGPNLQVWGGDKQSANRVDRTGHSNVIEWEEGKVFCFDDSYVHAAKHFGSEDRFVLMVSIWHPDLDLAIPQREYKLEEHLEPSETHPAEQTSQSTKGQRKGGKSKRKARKKSKRKARKKVKRRKPKQRQKSSTQNEL